MAISMSRTLLKGLGVRQVRAYSSAMTTAPVATFLPGDGIGPEIAKSVRLVFETAGVPLQWEEHHFSPEYIDPETNRQVCSSSSPSSSLSVLLDSDLALLRFSFSMVTRSALDSLLKNGMGLKGPMATPIGKGHRSLNLTLRKELGLYANIRPCMSIPGYKTKYDDVNLVTIRENTEGEYSGLEHEVRQSSLSLSQLSLGRARPG